MKRNFVTYDAAVIQCFIVDHQCTDTLGRSVDSIFERGVFYS